MIKKGSILAAAAAALLLAGAAVTAQTQKPAQARPQVYGVAFYNQENLFDTINNNGKCDLEFSPKGNRKWDGHKYWNKIHNMAYAISQLTTKSTPDGPAIIGVSEVENRTVLEDLVKDESLRGLNLQIIHHDSPDLRGIDVSVLYNPKLFRPINVTNHTLFIDSLPNFRTRDQMCVVGLLGPARVAVIVNHWPSRRGGTSGSAPLRDAAAMLTRHIADSLHRIDPNMGVIIMGDLNDDPYDRSCAKTLGAVKKMEDAAKGGYFNPFWKKLDDGIGSYIYRSGWNLFDQIIVSYELTAQGENPLEYFNAKVWNDKDFLLQQNGQYVGYPLRTYSSGVWTNGYSDHLPTEVFLRVRRK